MIYQPPLLKAVPEFGTDDAPRYAIKDLVNSQYWTGERFTPNGKKAMLYAHPNDACMDMRLIMMKVYEEEELTLYHAPTRIEVYGEHKMEELKHWLSRAALMRIVNSQYGNGPDNSLAMPSIHWAEMVEIERTDQ